MGRPGPTCPRIGFRAPDRSRCCAPRRGRGRRGHGGARRRRGARIHAARPRELRGVNPALRGKFLAGLHCTRDGAVESRVALPAIRRHLEASGRYAFHAGTEAREITSSSTGVRIRDDHDRTFDADLVIVCPGATLGGLARDLAGDLPLRRVRLQMMQTAPLGEALTTAIADGDSMRYYPAFTGSALDELRAAQPQEPTAAEHRMQLLACSACTAGSPSATPRYDEPFDFDVDEAPYRHLTSVVEEVLGRHLPPVVKRWAGVYSQCLDPAHSCTAPSPPTACG
ncbi:FAD-dependent oxidoreductase, partial [Rhodococcus hoagii]|nr:FAD-dependent oxidoreductase [Prescottella equi]